MPGPWSVTAMDICPPARGVATTSMGVSGAYLVAFWMRLIKNAPKVVRVHLDAFHPVMKVEGQELIRARDFTSDLSDEIGELDGHRVLGKRSVLDSRHHEEVLDQSPQMVGLPTGGVEEPPEPRAVPAPVPAGRALQEPR